MKNKMEKAIKEIFQSKSLSFKTVAIWMAAASHTRGGGGGGGECRVGEGKKK